MGRKGIPNRETNTKLWGNSQTIKSINYKGNSENKSEKSTQNRNINNNILTERTELNSVVMEYNGFWKFSVFFSIEPTNRVGSMDFLPCFEQELFMGITTKQRETNKQKNTGGKWMIM